jgi:hypothetical protein
VSITVSWGFQARWVVTMLVSWCNLKIYGQPARPPCTENALFSTTAETGRSCSLNQFLLVSFLAIGYCNAANVVRGICSLLETNSNHTVTVHIHSRIVPIEYLSTIDITSYITRYHTTIKIFFPRIFVPGVVRNLKPNPLPLLIAHRIAILAHTFV